MQFYSLKKRTHVEIPDANLEKMKMERPTKSGTQIRYAMTAKHDGESLFKFINEETFNASSAKEVKPTPKSPSEKKAAPKKASADSKKTDAKKPKK